MRRGIDRIQHPATGILLEREHDFVSPFEQPANAHRDRGQVHAQALTGAQVVRLVRIRQAHIQHAVVERVGTRSWRRLDRAATRQQQYERGAPRLPADGTVPQRRSTGTGTPAELPFPPRSMEPHAAQSARARNCTPALSAVALTFR